jgi:hypothetical protein
LKTGCCCACSRVADSVAAAAIPWQPKISIRGLGGRFLSGQRSRAAALFVWRLAARVQVNDLRRLAGLPAYLFHPHLPAFPLAPPASGLIICGLTPLYSLR